MKRWSVALMALAGAIAFASSASAKEQPAADTRFTQENLNRIEENLVVALTTTERPSLQASAAGVLRQVKSYAPGYEFSSAVIPLMSILKDESGDVASRILAALALHGLDSERGNLAIKMTARFSEQPRVKKLCAALVVEPSKQ